MYYIVYYVIDYIGCDNIKSCQTIGSNSFINRSCANIQSQIFNLKGGKERFPQNPIKKTAFFLTLIEE